MQRRTRRRCCSCCCSTGVLWLQVWGRASFRCPHAVWQGIKLLHDASPAVVEKRYSHLPFFRACAAIGRHHGVLSFYDGLAPAVAKGALTNCVRFVGYKGILRASGREENASAMESFGAGAVAALGDLL